ncbi:two-component system regulatory protein YycI [Enterococcus timonensis]|uniref:two-component system regulatory protein YycI n=1 Tax=Enterococcus timonensis TaxID=1852364 RepID=UPI0008DB06C3|nr:two-component system regulatory protein YycI [Enterococcus timonensis]
MDFRKIQGIFLIAFLGINFFLLTIFMESRSEENYNGNFDEKDAVETRLSRDKIVYEDSFSKESPQGYFIAAEETIFPKVLSRTADQDTTLNQKVVSFTDDYLINTETLAEDVKGFLTDPATLEVAGEYQLLEKASNLDGEAPYLIAGQAYEGLPFFDDTAKMQISMHNVQGDVFSIQQASYTHLDKIENLREKQDLISESDAISTLYYNSKIPQNAKINWLELAYGRILKVREKNVYVPIWFVSITAPDEKAHLEQVNAVNNTIITGNTIPTVEN